MQPTHRRRFNVSTGSLRWSLHMAAGLLGGVGCLGGLAPAQAQLVDASLLSDLRQAPAVEGGSAPGPFVRVAVLSQTGAPNRVYFPAFTPSEGVELWSTDGTSDGTTLAASIGPGHVGGSPRDLVEGTVTGGAPALYFLADDGATGTQLWRISPVAGFADTPVRLTGTTNQGPQPGAVLESLVRARDSLFFISRSTTGPELWRFNLTGTLGLTRVAEFTSAGQLGPLTAIRQNVYFAASRSSTDLEPWIYNGDMGGASQLANLAPGPLSSEPANFTQLEGAVIFSARGENGRRAVYRTEAGARPTLVAETTATTPAPWFATLSVGSPNRGTMVYFVHDGGLQRTTGAAAGTVQLAQAAGYGPATAPANLASLNGLVYFSGFSLAGGTEPWVTDGTVDGTLALADLAPGDASSLPRSFAAHNGAVYFGAAGPQGRELYRTEGRPGTTTLLRDLLPGVEGGAVRSSDPSQLTSTPLGLLMRAGTQQGGPAEPVISDGTAERTQLLRNINGGQRTQGSAPADFVAAGNLAFFTAQTGEGPGRAMCVTSGAANSVLPLFGGADGGPGRVRAVGGVVYFSGSTLAFGSELHRTDGTARGTFLVRDLNPGQAGSQPRMMTPAAGQLAFLATISGVDRLCVADGGPAGPPTGGGARVLAQHVTVQAIGLDNQFPVEGRTVYVAGADPEGVRGIYAVDLLTGAAPRVLNLSSVVGATEITGLARTGRTLYVTFGGTPVIMTRDLSQPSPFTPVSLLGQRMRIVGVADGRIFFQPAEPTSSTLLAAIGGGFSGALLSAAQGVIGPIDRTFTASVGRTLFFTAVTRSGGRELWASDGTPEGTRLVREIQARGPSSIGASAQTNTLLRRVGNWVYFTADNGEHGAEIWRTNGTEDGTTLVSDVRGGRLSSNPVLGAWARNHLVFGADDGLRGAEPFAIDVCPADWDTSGGLDPDDLSSFIEAYFGQPVDMRCDWNNDLRIDPDDLADYIVDYFSGCAP